jgi:phospholipase/carboxylesterase
MNPILPHVTLETAPNPHHSIIWLHGLGADGEDFVPIANEIELPIAVRYIFPHAPMMPVTLNNGYVMRAWYDIHSPASSAHISESLTWKQDENGIRAAQVEIEKLIDQENQRGVVTENIILAGFSQGGAVALHTGLRHAKRLGGILAMSTYLPLAEKLSTEINVRARKLPIFMAHGLSDPVVPFQLGAQSMQRMREEGCTVEWHEYDMAHTLCPDELIEIEQWLGKSLKN